VQIAAKGIDLGKSQKEIQDLTNKFAALRDKLKAGITAKVDLS
jgi:hypothetical protein